MTEGLRKADAAVSRGLACVALMGVWTWRGTNDAGGKTALADWEGIALNERLVYLAFDSDVTTKASVQLALARLKRFLESRGARVLVVYLPSGSEGAKVGLDDFFVSGKSVEDVLALASRELRPVRDAASPKGKKNQATQLVELARDAEFFHAPDGTAFASFRRDGRRETWPLRSKAFKGWLARRSYELEESVPGSQAIADALALLEGKACYEGHETEVFLRVGKTEERLYLDLANEEWEAVEIGPDGWRVVREPPVHFRRARGLLTLPTPVAGGSLAELWSLVNVPDEASRALVAGWLVSALRPTGPYFCLVVNGEHGSAKSTLSRLLRTLVDPCALSLRGLPREERDLVIAARNGWVAAFDNLSGLTPWISDALCRLATGGGFATRELYTDDEEVLFEGTRPLILNGIDDLLSRADLADRSLALHLPRIPEETRQGERALVEAFEAARPRLLGALLDGVCMALRDLASVQLTRAPRMADCAQWATAAEPALGFVRGSFLLALSESQSDAAGSALEADPLAAAIQRHMENGTEVWRGTAADLHAALESRVSIELRKSRSWPQTPRLVGNRLRRLAPVLRSIGINVSELAREAGTGRRLWELTRSNSQRVEPDSLLDQTRSACGDDFDP